MIVHIDMLLTFDMPVIVRSRGHHVGDDVLSNEFDGIE